MDRPRNFGFLLRDLTNRYTARFEQHAREISLTLVQCKVLVNLEKSEGASQAKLAELTGIEPMMMVRLLDRMEADHLVERRPDPSDRRARRLYLTKKARPLLDEIWRLSDVTRNEMFAGIGKTDRDTCMRALERMHENIIAVSDENAATPTAASSAAGPVRRAKPAALASK